MFNIIFIERVTFGGLKIAIGACDWTMTLSIVKLEARPYEKIEFFGSYFNYGTTDASIRDTSQDSFIY